MHSAAERKILGRMEAKRSGQAQLLGRMPALAPVMQPPGMPHRPGSLVPVDRQAVSRAEIPSWLQKLHMDFDCGLPLPYAMTLDEDEIAQLPPRLFALAGRRLEEASTVAAAGEAGALPPPQQSNLAGKLHSCGQDLMVIADAIAAITAA